MSGKSFRAWDKEKKKYIDPFLIDLFGNTYEISAEESEAKGCCVIIGNPNLIIEQYTGLNDRNGTEICQGDIVLDYYDGDDAFIVEWDKDTASFILTDTDNISCVSFDNFYPDKELEVIGNIHENSEPLEEKE